MPELVVLVDEANNVLGTKPKDEVHTDATPLHRAFSLFLFNSQGELLLTKRASTKKTFPGVWTNTVCGHPGPDETEEAAATRRLKDELGIAGVSIRRVSPYRYRFADENGIVENEICPILVGQSDIDPTPSQGEVDEWKWVDWEQFLDDTKREPQIYSPWCVEEAQKIKDLGVV